MSNVRMIFLCSSAALLSVACGCNREAPVNRAADESMIRGLDEQWSKTAGSHDLDGTVSYYSDDAVLLPPNAPAATGKQAIRASWADLTAPGVSIAWKVAKIDIAKSDDLAYTTGTYTLAMTDPKGKPVSDKGKFMEVWKKQSDGNWKATADMYSSDLPAQP